jgi:hypothetical protein
MLTASQHTIASDTPNSDPVRRFGAGQSTVEPKPLPDGSRKVVYTLSPKEDPDTVIKMEFVWADELGAWQFSGATLA